MTWPPTWRRMACFCREALHTSLDGLPGSVGAELVATSGKAWGLGPLLQCGLLQPWHLEQLSSARLGSQGDVPKVRTRKRVLRAGQPVCARWAHLGDARRPACRSTPSSATCLPAGKTALTTKKRRQSSVKLKTAALCACGSRSRTKPKGLDRPRNRMKS